MKETRSVEFNNNDKKPKEKILNYKIIIWTIFGFLILASIVFLALFINYKNKENKNVISEFDNSDTTQNKTLDVNGNKTSYGENNEESQASSKLQNAIDLINAQKYDEAITILDEEISKNPTANLYFNKGIAYLNSNRYEECVAAYDECLKLSPKNVYAYLNKAICLANVGEYKKALTQIDYALELDPENQLLINKKVFLEPLAK